MQCTTKADRYIRSGRIVHSLSFALSGHAVECIGSKFLVPVNAWFDSQYRHMTVTENTRGARVNTIKRLHDNYRVNVYKKINDCVNEHGGKDEIRCKEIKNQRQQTITQQDIFTT